MLSVGHSVAYGVGGGWLTLTKTFVCSSRVAIISYKGAHMRSESMLGQHCWDPEHLPASTSDHQHSAACPALPGLPQHLHLRTHPSSPPALPHCHPPASVPSQMICMM